MNARHQTLRGIIWALFGQSTFVIVWVLIKMIGARLPIFEVVFFRALFSLIILIPLTGWHHGSFKGNDWMTLFLRSLTGFIAMVMCFYAIVHMEIGNAVTLFNTLPIFVALLAPTLLDEHFSWKQFIFVLVAFIGIGLILKPDTSLFQSTGLLALGAGFLAAFAMICIRKLRCTDSVLIITLYFTAFTTLCAAPIALYQFVWPTLTEWFILGAIGVLVTVAQLALTRSYRFAPAATIAPFGYITVVESYIAGLIIFAEIPDLLSTIGAIVVIIGGTGVMFAAPKIGRIPGSTCGART